MDLQEESCIKKFRGDHPQNPKCPYNIMKQSIAVIRRCTVADRKPERNDHAEEKPGASRREIPAVCFFMF